MSFIAVKVLLAGVRSFRLTAFRHLFVTSNIIALKFRVSICILILDKISHE